LFVTYLLFRRRVFGLVDGSLSFSQMFLVGWCVFDVFLYVSETCCLSSGGESISTGTPQNLPCNAKPDTIQGAPTSHAGKILEDPSIDVLQTYLSTEKKEEDCGACVAPGIMRPPRVLYLNPGATTAAVAHDVACAVLLPTAMLAAA
jgi:hypothetical protein